MDVFPSHSVDYNLIIITYLHAQMFSDMGESENGDPSSWPMCHHFLSPSSPSGLMIGFTSSWLFSALDHNSASYPGSTCSSQMKMGFRNQDLGPRCIDLSGIWHHGYTTSPWVPTHPAWAPVSLTRCHPHPPCSSVAPSKQRRHPPCSDPHSSCRIELFGKGNVSKRRERPEEML